MPHLLLVRGPEPAGVDELPASEWDLSPAGEAACGPLAERLRGYAPAVVVASLEKRARQTAALLADHLGVTWHTAEDLHEHQHPTTPWMRPHDFEWRLERLFRAPTERVLGTETGEEAAARLSGAVDALLGVYPDTTLAVVTHGVVLALYLQSRGLVDGWATYSTLARPAFAALARPALGLVELATSV